MFLLSTSNISSSPSDIPNADVWAIMGGIVTVSRTLQYPGGQTRLVTKARKEIAAKLKNSTGPQRSAAETPGQRKQAWAQSLIENIPSASTQPHPIPPKTPPWEEPTDEHRQRENDYCVEKSTYSKTTRAYLQSSGKPAGSSTSPGNLTPVYPLPPT